MDVSFFASPTELRAWLEEHHDKTTELWVGFYKKGAGKTAITYAQALDEALCFGWIDGIRKTVDEISYTSRFTPRRPRSIWSDVNIARAGELEALGLMQPCGLKAFHERDEERARQYSYEERRRPLDEAYEKRFRENAQAWAFFQAQPPSYRRVAAWWVNSAKREETRLKRLAALIDGSEKGQRLASVARPAAPRE